MSAEPTNRAAHSDDIKRSTTDLDSLAAARLAAQQVTSARLFLDGPGTSYSTADLLRLRGDHAAAQDAVHAELTVDDPALARLCGEFDLFEVSSRAASPGAYLADPASGRRLDDTARSEVVARCPAGVDLQVALGDGLSPRAVARYGAEVLESLHHEAAARGWTIGRPFLVKRCRVGVLNDIGDLLQPRVVVLLIGERPGLQTAESMSAYMAYHPAAGHTDADRNLVCNIHVRGTGPAEAVSRIMGLARQMRTERHSGVGLKETMERITASDTDALEQ